MAVVFENLGLLDVRAITTIGVSVKTDSSAIGYFGSGIKAAIAILLRNNHTITIHSGEETYKFTTENANIRGKDFNIVHMNGQPLGFTTDFGKTWEMWMAMRELLCNAKDELGWWYKTDEEVIPKENTTLVVVEGQEFESAYDDRAYYILESEPIYATDEIDIRSKPTNNLYYKGVLVHNSDKKFLYTYNFLKHMDLTEDRVFKYQNHSENYELTRALAKISDQTIINRILNCGREAKEFELDWPSSGYSAYFLERIREEANSYNNNTPPRLLQAVAKSRIQLIREAPDKVLSRIQTRQLEKAIEFLNKLEFNVDDYGIKVKESLGERVLGTADQEEDIIYLSGDVFDLGTKYVAGTLYEEYVHIKHGVHDETRSFQDVVINHLMSVGENLIGEPL